MCYQLIQQFTNPQNGLAVGKRKSATGVIVTLREACDILEISEGAYLKWSSSSRKREQGTPESEKKKLVSILFDQTLKQLFEEHKRQSGYRRLTTCFQDQREACPSDSLLHQALISEKTVRLSLSRQGLKVKVKRSFKPSMTERTDFADTIKNLLLTNSNVTELVSMSIDYSTITDQQRKELALPNASPLRLIATQPRQVLVSDITYLPTSMKDRPWIYLCAWQDQYTKNVLGYILAYDQTSLTTNKALSAALKYDDLNRENTMICHADGGKQYTCDAALLLITQNRSVRSITRRNNTHDNAQAESLWARIKCELDIKHKNKGSLIFEDLKHAKTVLNEYLMYYNESRPHSSLGNRSPIIFEQRWLKDNEMSPMPSLLVVPPNVKAPKTNLTKKS